MFVFDGEKPAFKKATHIARRRQREKQDAVYRKNAEKLLLNRMKQQVTHPANLGLAVRRLVPSLGAQVLEDAKAEQVASGGKRKRGGKAAAAAPEVSSDDERATPPPGFAAAAVGAGGGAAANLNAAAAAAGSSGAAAAGPSGASDEAGPSGFYPPQPSVLPPRSNREQQQVGARCCDGEREGLLSGLTTVPGILPQVDFDEHLARSMEEQEQRQRSKVRPTSADTPVRAAIASMQGVSAEDALAIEMVLQEDERQLGGSGRMGAGSARATAVVIDDNGEDEAEGAFSAEEMAFMASRVAGETVEHEMRARARARASSSAAQARRSAAADREARASSDDDDNDGGLAMMLPADLSKLDAEALSMLPQSLQLEILEKMRDAQNAANREKFQEAAAERPQDFSSVQLQTYLKASAFRQKIEGFKKKIGGAADEDQARPLASDHSREFVFRRDGKPAVKAPSWQQSGSGRRGERGGGLSVANAAALAAPAVPRQRMAPLTTRVALAAFEGTAKADQQQQQRSAPYFSKGLDSSTSSVPGQNEAAAASQVKES